MYLVQKMLIVLNINREESCYEIERCKAFNRHSNKY